MPKEKIVVDRSLLTELQIRYSPFPENESEKIVNGFHKIIKIANKPGISIRLLMDEVGKIIHRLFEFKEIGIIVLNENDRKFRYITLIGFSKEAEMANKKLSYSENAFNDNNNFPHVKMGKNSEFHMAEYIHLEGEDFMKAYNRPSILLEKRDSHDDFLEGDYIDIDIRDPDNNLLGWFELGNTKDKKLPSRSTILWLEFIASLLGMIIQKEEKLRK